MEFDPNIPFYFIKTLERKGVSVHELYQILSSLLYFWSIFIFNQ